VSRRCARRATRAAAPVQSRAPRCRGR
jgi:hypothetical protein